MTALSSNVLFEKMLSEFNLRPATAITIESANCKSQSKCVTHFSDIRNIADTFNSTIIRAFHIPEHGGEVDHVGGIAKSAIKREVGTDEILIEVKEMVEFLQSKFSTSVRPIITAKCF